MRAQGALEFIDLFDRGVSLDRAAECLVAADGSNLLTYGDVHELTHRLAFGLARRGLGAGSRVGVLSPNDPLALVLMLAILRLGATWIPLNGRSSAQDLEHLLTLTRADAVLCHDGMARLGEQLSCGRSVIAFGNGQPSCPAWQDLLGPAGDRYSRPPALGRPAVLAGTGGTTGLPKAVMIGHSQLYHLTLGFLIHMAEPAPPTQLVAAPITHAAGALTFPVLASGGRSVIHRGVVAEELLESVECYDATRLFLPPTSVYSLLDSPALGTYDTSSLRHFLYTAAPMNPNKLVQAIEAFGPVMCQAYGQTEALNICTWLSPQDHATALASEVWRGRLSSCGRVSAVATLAIVDDNGEPVAPGELGEIVVRGPLVMDGYLDNPEATEAAIRDGWLLTGDVGRVDDDGFVYIVDRKKDMIITGGFNVYPGRVESVLLSHPAVRDGTVIGLPDEKWGERVTAVIELRAGHDVTAEDIKAYCRQRLDGVHAPKEIIVRELPRSPVGKVLKRALRDEYWHASARQV